MSDGTHSKVYTSPNLFALPKPVWSAGASLTGLYTLIRPADSAPGNVLAYSPASAFTGWQKTWDFLTTSGASDGWQVGGQPGATWVFGQGWISGDAVDGVGNWHRTVNIEIPLSGIPLTFVKFTYNVANKASPSTPAAYIFVSDGTFLAQVSAAALANGNGQVLPWSGTHTIPAYLELNVEVDFKASAGALSGGPSAITGCTLIGTGPCPFSSCDGAVGSGDANVAASSDDGATWATPIDLGTSPGSVGGFDVQHDGTVSYAAIQGAVKKASTLGGSYSGYASFGANPILIEMPWGTKNSRSPNGGPNPEVIVGLDAPDSGKTLLWFVGGSPVDITPVIGGYPGIPVGANCLCTWLGIYIALIATFGSSQRLVTSNDGGAHWQDKGPIDANYLRLRRLARTPGQLYAAGDIFDYSPDFGYTLVGKSKPGADALQFFEPFG